MYTYISRLNNFSDYFYMENQEKYWSIFSSVFLKIFERKRELRSPLCWFFSNSHNRQEWARLKSRAANSLWVSHLNGRGSRPRASCTASLGALAGSWDRRGEARTLIRKVGSASKGFNPLHHTGKLCARAILGTWKLNPSLPWGSKNPIALQGQH